MDDGGAVIALNTMYHTMWFQKIHSWITFSYRPTLRHYYVLIFFLDANVYANIYSKDEGKEDDDEEHIPEAGKPFRLTRGASNYLTASRKRNLLL